jgi:DNA invertase Pin-like site-specific DNA recombinase
MKEIKYIRVSTTEQNTERQENNANTLIDKCSGSIPFIERKNGSKLLRMANNDEVNTIKVHSIDRLGRNTLDILNTIQTFTELGVNVVSEKEGLNTLLPNGKENPTSKLIINILATLSEFELNMIKERQREGIANAKAKGVYASNGGNKQIETATEFLSKSKNAKCLKELKNGNSIRRSASISGVSNTTAQKVKKLILS